MILFTGKGTSGSWIVRGEQLGAACGATVKPKATRSDCKRADIVVVVKRPHSGIMEAIGSRPWVWDVIDFYPQPTCTGWSKSQSIDWVKAQIKSHRPTAVVWPNHRMMMDCDTGLPGVVIPHHYRPDIKRNPIRENVRVIGYEGSIKYLGKWGHALRDECLARDWEFVVNPGSLADLDIVVAFRDSAFNGYAQKHWKSNVKLANAHASGTPFIGPRENGYTETGSGFEQWTNDPHGLSNCLDRLSGQNYRRLVHDEFISRSYSVADAAHDLQKFMGTLNV